MASTRKLSAGRAGGARSIADGFNGPRIRVHAEDFVAFPEQIDQIASVPAARVEDPHPGRDTATKQLIEEIDVDLSELLLKIGHCARIFRCRYQEKIP